MKKPWRVRRITRDGRPHKGLDITHDDILAGGTMHFVID